MKYFDLISQLKKNKLIIFSLTDIGNLFPTGENKTLKNNLSRWTKMGRFVKLRKNLYEYVEAGLELNISDVYAANRIYAPSYISCETALSIYGLIPEVAAQLISVTPLPTRKFKNKHGSFFYRSCQKRAFIGYKLMQYEGFKVIIADKEKAMVDFIYFSLRQRGSLDFDEERFDKNILKELSWKKIFSYAKLFNNKTVLELERLREWVKC